MTAFPGFPCNDFDFQFAHVGPALAGLIVRDTAGNPVPGILPSTNTLVSHVSGWSWQIAPFVAVRVKGRAVLIGGADEDTLIESSPAPSAGSRIDVIYSLPADVGAGDTVEAVAVQTGVAAGVPSKPTIPAGAIELATLTIASSATSGAQATLVHTFPFTAAAGGVLRARSKAQLDGYALVNGSRALTVNDGGVWERVGGAWVLDAFSWTSFFSPRSGLQLLNGSMVLRGRKVELDMVIGSTTPGGKVPGNTWIGYITPEAYRPLFPKLRTAEGTGTTRGQFRIYGRDASSANPGEITYWGPEVDQLHLEASYTWR